MNEGMDPDAFQMDIDPSLSLTAEGLWSDEESLYNPNSDSDDPDLSTSTPSAPSKRKVTSPFPFEVLMNRAADENTRFLHLHKSRISSLMLPHYTPQAT